MTTSLAPVDNGEALPGLLGEDSYVLPPALPFERWEQIGVSLQQMHRSVNWWVADWLLYGEAHYGQDAYQAVQAATGRGDESLSQVVWVARAFPPHTRVPSLSWSHHRAAAELPADERQAVLREAAEQQLSTRQLIERVRDRQAAISAESRAVDGPACAAEAGLREPTEDDLTDDARAALRFKADTLQVRDRGSFAAGWVAALHWAEVGDVFEGGADA